MLLEISGEITPERMKRQNQSKLEVVKQKMARVNFDILRISELNWTGRNTSWNQDCQEKYQ